MRLYKSAMRFLIAGVFVLVGVVSPVKAGLLNTTIDADIELVGQDDNGFYTIDIFDGLISVGSGFSNTYNFFKQLTQSGFSTASNQLFGNVGLSISDDAITLTFSGQAQPVLMTGVFSDIAPTITSAVETSSGFLNGVALALPNSFTANSVTISAFYLGYQPGTNTSQTDRLTFGTTNPDPVPEPATMLLFGAGLTGLAAARRRKKAS